MAVQLLEVVDFSGGVTDYYLNAPQNKMHVCDNLLLVQYQGLAKPFTRPGSNVYAPTYSQIPAGAQRISTAFIVDGVLFVQSATALYRDSGSAWVAVTGPTSNPAFPGATTASVFTYSEWSNQVYLAYSDQRTSKKLLHLTGDAWQVREAGLPKATGGSITPNAGAANYLYKLVYKSTFVDNDGVTFIDRGEPSDAIDATGQALPLTVNLPTLANTANDNYPVAAADLKVEVYRTIDNGTVYYLVGTFDNGTASFADSTSDVSLQLAQTLYTEGGVAEASQPPPCSIVHTVRDKAYYAGINDPIDGQIPNRLLQSIPGDLDGVPGNFFVDMDDRLIGVSSVRSTPVAICSKSAYRIDGEYDLLGRGGMLAERISDRATCISAQGIVQTLEGVFWAGVDGIYYTDGYEVIKINEDYDKTWASFVTGSSAAATADKRKRIQGKYDRRKRRVWWTIQHESINDVDKCYVLDLNFPIGKHSTFTTISGLDSFSPTAVEFDSNGDLIRCDRRGYVLKHDDLTKSDPKIDTAVASSTWGRQTIFYEIETIAYNFGTTGVRKFVPRVDVVCESTTNLSLGITSINDDRRKVADLNPIRYRGNITWGDPDVYWGDATLVWNQQGLIDQQRRFPAQNLRCNYKQLVFTNALVAIINSDSLGTATVDKIANTVTLNSGTFDWPDLAVDYFMAFENDGYVREYRINTRNSDTTLTLDDDSDALVTSTTAKWVMRGYPKNEVLNMISYVIQYEIYGRTQDAFKSGSSGEVGAT